MRPLGAGPRRCTGFGADFIGDGDQRFPFIFVPAVVEVRLLRLGALERRFSGDQPIQLVNQRDAVRLVRSRCFRLN
jgi:hypothetical protein